MAPGRKCLFFRVIAESEDVLAAVSKRLPPMKAWLLIRVSAATRDWDKYHSKTIVYTEFCELKSSNTGNAMQRRPTLILYTTTRLLIHVVAQEWV
jgi:hypothetical protein